MKVKNSLILCALVLCGYFYFNKNKQQNKIEDCYIENIGSDCSTFDPHKCNNSNTARVMYDLFEPLILVNQYSEFKPGVAEKYDISDDYKTYIFYLRKNLKWSNGEPLTAHDFEYSFKRMINPSTASPEYAFLLDSVENSLAIQKKEKNVDELGVKAIDDTTLEVKLSSPDPAFLSKISLVGCYPVPKKVVEKYGNNWIDIDKIVTNGAYKISKIVHNGYIELEKNPYYWYKDNVKINKVKFLMISDASSDVQSFKTNTEHCTYINLPPNDIDYYKKTYEDQFKIYNVLDQERISFNLKNEKFKDIRVRKALSIVIDREKLTKQVLKIGIPSYGIILENTYNGYYKDLYKEIPDYIWVEKPMEERIKMAKDLLIEAGYSKGKPLCFQLAYPNQSTLKTVGTTIQAMWNEVFEGLVEVSFVSEDWKVYMKDMSTGSFEVFRSRWMADFNLPSTFTELYTSTNGCNFGKYSNANYDNLYRESLQGSFEEYLIKQKDLAKIAMIDYPSIPLYGVPHVRLVKSCVKNYDPSNNVLDIIQTKDLVIEKNM